MPSVILMLTIALVSGNAPSRARATTLAIAAGALIVARLAAESVPPDASTLHLAAWIAVAVTSLALYAPVQSRSATLFFLAAIDGLLAGTLLRGGTGTSEMVAAAAALLVCFPSAWLVERGGGIALRVATSWLTSAAVLIATLPAAPVLPGYAPDHLE